MFFVSVYIFPIGMLIIFTVSHLMRHFLEKTTYFWKIINYSFKYFERWTNNGSSEAGL